MMSFSEPRIHRHWQLNGVESYYQHKLQRNRILHQICQFGVSRKYNYLVWHRTPCTALALEKVQDRYNNRHFWIESSLLSGGLDASIALWDTQPDDDDLTARTSRGRIQPIGSVPRTALDRAITYLSWYKNDTGIFVSSSNDGYVKVWDTNLLEEATRFAFQSQVHMIDTNTSLIAVATKETHIRLCDMRVGSSIQSLQGHDHSIYSVCWYPPKQDKMLISGSHDGTIRLWDIRQGKSEISIINRNLASVDHAIMGVAIEPCFGTFLVAMLKTGLAQVWDVHSGQLVCETQTQYRPLRTLIPAIVQQSNVVSGYLILMNNQTVSYIDIPISAQLNLQVTTQQHQVVVGRSFGGPFSTGVQFSQKRMLILGCDEVGSVQCFDTSDQQTLVPGQDNP